MSEVVVPGAGPLATARTLGVGEAPGEQEEKHGKPFWPEAPSGKQVTRALGGPEGRAATYLTNAAKARGPKGEKPETHLARLTRWLPALQEEFDGAHEARSVFLVGEDAFKAVLGSKGYLRRRRDGSFRREDERGISLWHGSVITRAEAEAMRALHEGKRPMVERLPARAHTFVVTLHPAWAMRGKWPFMPSIRANIARAARWGRLEAGPERPPEETFHLTPPPDEVEAALQRADEARVPWATDVETPMDAPHHITTWGVATPWGVWCGPWEGRFRDVIRDALARPGVTAGHHVTFDLNAYAAYGIQPGDRCGCPWDAGCRCPRRYIWDTIVAQARLEPPFEGSDKSRWLALASVVPRLFDGVFFWKKPDWATTQALYRVNWPGIMEHEWLRERLYCGLDNWHTRRLQGAQRELLKKEKML